MSHSRFKPLLHGVLALLGLIGVATLVWAAIPSGAPVVYTGTDLVAMPAGTTFSAQILNALAPFTASQSLTAQQAVNLTGVITPPQVTATQNDYSPTGLSTAFAVRVSTNASQTFTGLATGGLGRLLIVENIGTQNAVLAAENTSSTAANRFDFPGDLTLIPKAMVLLKYDNTSLRWRSSFPSLTAGPVSASFVDYVVQGSAPSPPGAGFLRSYAQAGGQFNRDSAGNIVGPLGPGGGGGGTTVPAAVLVTPTNITLSGEQTFETVTTNATRVFVAGQTTQTQNGFYVTSSGAWSRASDALAGAAFTAGTLVTITGGVQSSVGNKGSVWMFTSSGTYNSSNLTSLRTAPGAAGELIASRSTITTSVPSGTIGSDTGGRVPWNRAGSYAAHGDLSASSQIIPTAQTMGIQNAGAGNLLLTPGGGGNPRITGCSAATGGTPLYLMGLSTTKTVTIPDGNGVLLAGALGSGGGAAGGVTIGSAPGGTSAEFICNGVTSVWEQVVVTTLQQAKNAGAAITNAEIEASGVRLGGASDYCIHYGNTTKCYCGGVACTGATVTNLVLATNGAKPTCAVGERRKVWPTDGGAGVADTLEICKKDAADAYAWGSLGTGGVGGAVTSTIPLSPDTINVADSNAYLDTMDRTNYDTSVTRFTDNVTGCVHYKAHIPANLASTPSWNVQIWHSAVSGAGGNVVLTLTAKTFATNVAKDAAFTSLTLPSSGVVAVSTSANTTLTTLGSTNFDSTVALTANQLLRLTLCRTGGSGSDSLNVDWLLENLALRVDLN